MAQVISRNLKQIGVDAKLNVKDWSQINTALFGGTFTGNIAWSQAGVTPFEYYASAMSAKIYSAFSSDTQRRARIRTMNSGLPKSVRSGYYEPTIGEHGGCPIVHGRIHPTN